jgi:hypothetical protein
MSSNMQQPILQRSTPYAYEKLAEKNESIRSSISLFASSVGSSGAKKNGVTADEEFTLGSISSVLLSIENPSLSSSDDECSYSYSAESVESHRHKQKFHGGRLGATPSSEKGGEFNSLSPVKRREDNVTLDIPGCSDWSFDISRMSMPAVASERGGGEEAIAQDANFVAVDTRDDSLTTALPSLLVHNLNRWRFDWHLWRKQLVDAKIILCLVEIRTWHSSWNPLPSRRKIRLLYL